LLIKPSRKNIHVFLENVREVVRRAEAIATWELIAKLNWIIRGWTMYHGHVCSKRIFSRVDYAIFKALWQWALKRDSRKGKRWIMRKYFARRGGRGWCFFGEKKDSGQREIVWLFHATSLPIRRHVKIKREADPYIIPHGRCTSKLVRVIIRPTRYGVVERCSISGAPYEEYVSHVVTPSLRRRDGTAITSSQKCWVDLAAQRTVNFFIHNVTGNCTPNSAASAAASLTRRSEGLSRVSWKLSRTVLRGAGDGNVARLLDQKLNTKTKQPSAIALKSGEPHAFAGLLERWKDRKAGADLLTFTVITTDPNEVVQQLHDRMPCIIPKRDYDRWLIPGDPLQPPIDLLRPFDAEKMTAWRVDAKVGDVKNDTSDLIEPVSTSTEEVQNADGEVPRLGSLFS
jgi:SOS response associated peptidase (SRAP)/Group II intron, maturase-specific domain